jgi:hypothetical protein
MEARPLEGRAVCGVSERTLNVAGRRARIRAALAVKVTSGRRAARAQPEGP